jgi:hypothetical protein
MCRSWVTPGVSANGAEPLAAVAHDHGIGFDAGASCGIFGAWSAQMESLKR